MHACYHMQGHECIACKAGYLEEQVEELRTELRAVSEVLCGNPDSIIASHAAYLKGVLDEQQETIERFEALHGSDELRPRCEMLITETDFEDISQTRCGNSAYWLVEGGLACDGCADACKKEKLDVQPDEHWRKKAVSLEEKLDCREEESHWTLEKLIPIVRRLINAAKMPGIHTDAGRKFLRDMGELDPTVRDYEIPEGGEDEMDPNTG